MCEDLSTSYGYVSTSFWADKVQKVNYGVLYHQMYSTSAAYSSLSLKMPRESLLSELCGTMKLRVCQRHSVVHKVELKRGLIFIQSHFRGE